MSHNSIVTCVSPTATTFLSTFTPTVVRYLSEKMLLTNRETRLVLPTPDAPSMQIFFSIIAAAPWRRRPRRRARGSTHDDYAACRFLPSPKKPARDCRHPGQPLRAVG